MVIHAFMTPIKNPAQDDLNALKNNGFFLHSLACVFVFFGVVYGSSAAFSKVAVPGDDILSVNTRINPEYEPNGIRVGDFVIRPSISTGATYSDNIYASDANEVHDLLFNVNPSVNIQSDFVRHSITAAFSMDDGSYKDTSSEDYTDYGASMNARIDVSGDTALPVSFSYSHTHYQRDNPDDRASLEPTVFDLWNFATGIVHRGQRIAFKVLADVQKFIFQDGTSIAGRVDNSDRDRAEWTLYTSLGMAEEAFLAPYIYTELSKTEYERDRDSLGFDRNSSGYEAGVGTIINFSEITRASFNIGYISRDIGDSRFDDVGGLSYGVNIVWEPSTLAAFMLEGKRTLEETTVTNAGVSVNSTLRLSMNYELFPNVLLNPSTGYREIDYDGIDRTIEAYDAGLNVTYKMNQNLWLSGSYRYITQEDKGTAADFDDYDSNSYGLSMKLQF